MRDVKLLIINKIGNLSKNLIKKGKKNKAYFLVYNFLKIIKNNEKNFLCFLKKLEKKLSLKVDFKIQRKSGVQRKIPKKISYKRSFLLPLRWLVENAKKRKELTFFEKLFFESLDTFDKKSVTFRKKNEWHKTAINNKHFIK